MVKQARVLIHRLERLSADSSYAHRASGLRGAIIRGLDGLEVDGVFSDPVWMQKLINQGDKILVEAARQIPESD